MGAIQGSINSMLGTAAVAIGGAKKVQADAAAAKSANTEEMIKLTEQIPAEEKNLSGLTEESENIAGEKMQEISKLKGVQEEAEKAMKELNVPGKEQEYNAAEETSIQAQKDIAKHELAIKEAEGKVAAKQLQVNYYKERMNALLGGRK